MLQEQLYVEAFLSLKLQARVQDEAVPVLHMAGTGASLTCYSVTCCPSRYRRKLSQFCMLPEQAHVEAAIVLHVVPIEKR